MNEENRQENAQFEEDAKVLARLAASPNDENAWRDLYIRFRPFVFGSIYHNLGGAIDETDDLCQEVFLRLVKYDPFTTLRRPKAFREYLRVICLNVSRNFLRRLYREGKRGDQKELLEHLETLIDAQDAVSLENELLEVIELAAKRLSHSEQETLKHLIAGRDASEMAEKANISYGQAAMRIHRVRVKLRSLLSDTTGT